MQDFPARSIGKVGTTKRDRMRSQQKQIFMCMIAPKFDKIAGELRKSGYDPRSIELDGPAGVLHAKAVVADGESVFTTSANLTDAALDRNIELGVLIRDRALAASVTSHFQGLIDREVLNPLPAE